MIADADFLSRGGGGNSPRVFTACISQEKCGIWLEHPSRFYPSSLGAALCSRPLPGPQRPRTEVGAGRADPSLGSAVSRHRAILSLVVM